MLFSSIPFLYYFLPAVLVCYFLAPARAKNAVLLLFSLLFYGWGEPRYLLVMLLAAGLGYGFGLGLGYAKAPALRKALLVLSVGTSLAVLIWFKYADFFLENANALLGTAFPLLGLALPVGISFYTFQCISYAADVYRGDTEPQKNFIAFGAYVSMFPQLIAGPIVRYVDVAPALSRRKHSREDLALGLRRFLVGLGKKILLANQLGALTQSYRDSSEPTVLFSWLYAAAFLLQIYYDFSGYSDMAIGVARILGISLPKNFDLPYLSHNVTEFWKRWHISLSLWLRDYLYIPLGGNRKGRVRTCINLMITMVLGGIWHGASWNYAVWGALHGAALIIHKYWAEFTGSKTKEHGFASNLCSTAVTFAFVSITWVFFRTSSVEVALQIIGRIFSFANGVRQVYTWFFFAFAVLLVSSGVSAFCCRKRKLKTNGRNQSRAVAMTPYLNLTKVWNLTLFFCFCGLILGLANTGGSPFIYGKY